MTDKIIRIDLSTPILENLEDRDRLISAIHAEIRAKLRELSRAHYALYPQLSPTIYSDRLNEIVCVAYANVLLENDTDPVCAQIPDDHEFCAEYRELLGIV